MVEALSGVFLDAGLHPVEALVALDIAGMTILGLTNMHAASITGAAYSEHEHSAELPGPEVLSSERFPNLARALSEASGIDADLEFDRAMRVLAAGLLVMHRERTLAPTGEEARAVARRRAVRPWVVRTTGRVPEVDRKGHASRRRPNGRWDADEEGETGP